MVKLARLKVSFPLESIRTTPIAQGCGYRPQFLRRQTDRLSMNESVPPRRRERCVAVPRSKARQRWEFPVLLQIRWVYEPAGHQSVTRQALRQLEAHRDKSLP